MYCTNYGYLHAVCVLTILYFAVWVIPALCKYYVKLSVVTCFVVNIKAKYYYQCFWKWWSHLGNC